MSLFSIVTTIVFLVDFAILVFYLKRLVTGRIHWGVGLFMTTVSGSAAAFCLLFVINEIGS